MYDSIQLTVMKLIPKRTISRFAGAFARSRFSRPFISAFARKYAIDLDEAELTLADYHSLTEFFIRKLKPGSRPIASGDDILVSPVDGVVSQAGEIAKDRLIQAKGVNYSILELLGQDYEKARSYENGTFLTIYLSPSDYHRIHTPIAGEVRHSTYIPGTLFPVNPFGVSMVKGLFARNERLVTYLQSRNAGMVALVKVGAIIVGSVRVNYSACTTNLPGGRLEKKDYPAGIRLAKGEELGRFEFGSTVILLFQPGRIRLDVSPGQRVRMGQAIGRVNSL